MSSKTKSTAKGSGRVAVKNLQQSSKELSQGDLKKVKGGVIRSVGNRDGGGTSATQGGSGSSANLLGKVGAGF